MQEDNDEFFNMKKKSTEFEKVRQERKKILAKEKLFSMCKQKISTTMIGAISSLEKSLVDSLHDKSVKVLFEKVRSEILDNGNKQIRNLQVEFENYDIISKKKSITFKIIEG